MTALARPSMRWTDVSSHLVDFAMTTYDVAPAALAALLPDGFEPELGQTADGRERAFVSAVTFLNTRFYVAYAPFVRLRCFQTNYRAYVRYRGARGVWFFGTHLDSVLVHMPRVAWRLPWSRSRVRARSRWDGAHCAELEWSGRGGEGAERLLARGARTPMRTEPSFGDPATTRQVLLDPSVGWLRCTDGALATYSVWHAPLEPERCEPVEARFEAFERRGLIVAGQPPCSVLVQRVTHYLVRLPPRRVRA